jgi:hypothetical protein
MSLEAASIAAEQHGSTKSRMRKFSAVVSELIARVLRERRIQEENAAGVPFTWVPAKETPSPRAPRAVPKDQTALTGDVPTGPVAMPGNKTTVSAAGCKASLASIASSASAFGTGHHSELAALPGLTRPCIVGLPKFAVRASHTFLGTYERQLKENAAAYVRSRVHLAKPASVTRLRMLSHQPLVKQNWISLGSGIQSH